MKRLFGFLICSFFLNATAALAQGTAVPTSKLAWDQASPDLATASAYTYKYYPDGATAGTTLAMATCTGTASPFVCTAAFPAFTPGNHSLTMTAGNAAGDSAQSTALAFIMVVQPAAPTNLSIK